MHYFLKGNYYFDLDLANQLRIAGPQNHLFCGITFPESVNVTIAAYQLKEDQLHVYFQLDAKELEISLPIVTDIRTIRNFTEDPKKKVHPTYESLISQGLQEIMPHRTTISADEKFNYVECKNSYLDEEKQYQEYGCKIKVLKDTSIQKSGNRIIFKSKKQPIFFIETIGNVGIKEQFNSSIFRTVQEFPRSLFPPRIYYLYLQAAEEIQHLIKTRKTSGFEYGTIFPRDWIESADLGNEDLTQETIDYMYEQSMQWISEHGEGWHENIVGEYKTKVTEQSQHINRSMVDIEPKYILGMKVLSSSFITQQKIQGRLQLVARYLVQNAKEHNLVTFKKQEKDPETYHHAGNWRDSEYAYPRQKAPLAPYDVNCVLYPESLKVISDHAEYFAVDKEEIDELIKKWNNQKQRFRLYHPDDIVGYSLALHGKKRVPLPVAHLDESYDLFYADPSMEEVVSFAQKILRPDFFYTPVGPVLVASDEDEFSSWNYHGKVIWPKQAAYSVAGLTRQYFRGKQEGWPDEIIEEIKNSALKTAEACFEGWMQLNAIPELYYFDSKEKRAKLYTSQKEYEGEMSIIQLWSAVGARRIIGDYALLLGYNI